MKTLDAPSLSYLAAQLGEALGQQALSLRPIASGHWSTVYHLSTTDGPIAIKLSDQANSSLQIEYNALTRASDASLAVPEPLALGVLPDGRATFLAMTYVNGDLLESKWASLPQRTRTHLLGRFLDLISGLNSLSIEGFGPCSPSLEGRYATFADYVSEQIYQFESSPARPYLDSEVWESLAAGLHHQAACTPGSVAVLAHADFRLRNLIYSNGDITLIDFGNAMATIPAFEFFRFTRVDKAPHMLSLSDLTFLTQGYRASSSTYDHDVPVCRALLAMSLSNFGISLRNAAMTESFVRDIVLALDELRSLSY